MLSMCSQTYLNADADQQAKITLLRLPQTYPDSPERIELVETHMSWVFLTDRHAFKLKKPVQYDYLDFSTLAARKSSCEEEVRLNQRLAPGMYLGAVPLAVDRQGKVRIGGQGAILDWLVKMRRLPAERMLDYRIRHHLLQPAELRAAAEWLANFYRDCTAEEISGGEYRERYLTDVRANYKALVRPHCELPAAPAGRVRDTQIALLETAPELFDQRAVQGRIVEGHGDLRPEHVCLESPPVVFDRLEFNRSFRIVDAADELAGLSMECDLLDAPQVEGELFDAYGRITGDRPSPQLVMFYKAHRACVRARLAIWHLRNGERSTWPRWCAVARTYLEHAESYVGTL
jgi:aminoglycoside phosphotransferase family enzyme